MLADEFGIQTESEAQTDAVFAKLSEGGTVVMPLEKTFLVAALRHAERQVRHQMMVNQCQPA